MRGPRRMIRQYQRTLPWLTPAAVAVAMIITVAAGCAKQPRNPSFDVSTADAKRALKAMAKDEKPLERPVVVLGGYHDIGIGPASFLPKLRGAVHDDRIVSVTY